jgi:hypothetical protein
MKYSLAIEKLDLRRIDKLNQLHNLETFWDDVRKLTKRISSDHSLRHWQALAEVREKELKEAEKLNDELFVLRMKDIWDMNDRNKERELCEKIKELKGQQGYGKRIFYG